jgi:diaminopimelate epimerase
MDLTLKKYTGLGNDYLIYDPNKAGDGLTNAHIQLVCNRNFGLGSDGILVGPLFTDGKISVRIFNPDGSEAEKSGNGIMIFSKYLKDEGYVTGTTVTIGTVGGDVTVEYLDARAETMRVNMGRVSFWSDEVPVVGDRREVVDEPMQFKNKTLNVTCLTTGIPHCIVPMENISRDLVCDLGQRIECASQFPKRINVDLMQVIDRSNLAIESFERGVGYTLSSGSSACAAAAAAYKLGLADASVTVHMPGGAMSAHCNEDGTVSIVGYVRAVCEMTMTEQDINSLMSI